MRRLLGLALAFVAAAAFAQTLTGPPSPTTGTGAFVRAASPTLTGTPAAPTPAASDNSTTLATTAFVQSAVVASNPAVAVQAATTAAGNTSGLTYLNGVAGIGATLTGAVNTALTVDGYTFTALGQRLLVKNDTQSPSGAYNGVYYVTQVQTAILPLILTRALDYDQPSDINNTGSVPVVSGTANGGTSWLLTSAVATVGTDPLTYSQFTISATGAALSVTGVAGNASAVRADIAAAADGQFLRRSGTALAFGDVVPAATPTTTAVGYLGAPENTQNGTYTLVMSDAGKIIYHTSGSAHTWTIDSNANVAWPIGTTIVLINENGGGNVTVAITSDTLRWGSSTGSRTLAANGTATVTKVAATTWRMTGDGIT